MKMRLQRFLAQAGIASRRKCEELIVAGQVQVNGKPATELGTQVDPDRDKVVVAGKRVLAEPLVYLLLHKPKGYVTTASDPDGRPTVFDLVRSRERIFPVGRLDFNTEGVLLLTNDGDLAFALMHPRHQIEKVYHAKLQGPLNTGELQELRNGVTLDDGTITRPADVHVIGDTGKHTWVEITLREGKNRQIHRMGDAVGHRLLKLTRVLYGGISFEGLKPGHWRPLTDEEVEHLKELSEARETVMKRRAPRSLRGAPPLGSAGRAPQPPRGGPPRSPTAIAPRPPRGAPSRSPAARPPQSPRGASPFRSKGAPPRARGGGKR